MSLRGSASERGGTSNSSFPYRGTLEKTDISPIKSATSVESSSSPLSGAASNVTETDTKSIASVLTLRGGDAGEAANVLSQNSSKEKGDNLSRPRSRSFGSGYMSAAGREKLAAGVLTFTCDCVAWASLSNISLHTSHQNCQVHSSTHITNGYMRSASLLSNSQSIIPVLQRPITKAASMFRVGAYVHQYERYGIAKEDFVSSFRTISQIVENYRTI